MNVFTTYYNNVRSGFKNTCHTLARYTCYDTPANTLKAVTTSSWDSLMKHKFYKAPDCVRTIMGGSAGFVIFKSLFVLFALFALML